MFKSILPGKAGLLARLFSISILFFLSFILSSKNSLAQAQPKKADHGKVDTCYIEFTQKQDKIIAKINLSNDQKLAGAAIPLKYGNGKTPLQVDSVTFSKSRTQGFAWKEARFKEKDLNNDSLQAILIGLIANLGGAQQPLDKGKGPVAYIHFTVKTDKSFEVSLDTTSLPPNNTLMVIDVDAGVVPLAFKKGTFQANGKK